MIFMNINERENITMNNFKLHNEAKIIFNNKIYLYKEIRRQMDIYQSALSGIGSAAVMVDRSVELLILLMAMLESGITFLPIDHSNAVNRTNYMLQDSQMEVVITNEKYYDTLEYPNKIIFEHLKEGKLPEPSGGSDSIAYILYTSGSTGIPKGIMVSWSALENFMEGVSEVVPLSPGKKIACLTTVSFDIFLLESVVALCKGLTVILANEEEQKSPRHMVRLIKREKAEILQMTPSRLQLLFHADDTLDFLKNIQIIMLGGEQLPLEMLQRLQRNSKVEIYNMYGPTETTIWSSIAYLTKSKSVHIGLPIKNTDIYILDENHHIVLDGTVGEIAISGQGLSLGYVNLETETKEKFIFLPEANKKVYLTGDLGSISKDHFLHYVGRVDNQIKLRGYRIELEEIETVLNGFDTIEQAVVTVEEGKQANRLIAFYVAQKDVDRQQLTDWLKSRLPDYMLPACYIRITQFPLTLNGKIDRKQLRVNDLLPQTNEPDLLVEENSEVASKVISLISEMTNVKNNSITCKTTLTELGIDSITFIKLIVNLEEMFGFEFDDQMLLFTAFPNIQTMIDYVEENIAL